MNLGGSQHFYSHLTTGISLWMLFLGAPDHFNLTGWGTLILWGVSFTRKWTKRPLFQASNVVTIIYVTGCYLFSSNILDFFILVILLFTLNRLFVLRDSSDHQQLYLLTFANIVLAANLEFELSYGLLLFAYMLSVTTCLTLNHLRRELEKSVHTDHSLSELYDQELKSLKLSILEPVKDSLDDENTFDSAEVERGEREARELKEERERKKNQKLIRLLSSKRLISWPLLLGVSLIASILCICAIIFFFLLPRVGGQWFQGYKPVQHQAGFSGDVNLGQIGEIQLNEQIAFRVRVHQFPPEIPLYIGGQLPIQELEDLSLSNRSAQLNEPSKNRDVDQAFSSHKGPLSNQQRYWVGRTLNQYSNGRWRSTQLISKSDVMRHTYWLSSVNLKTSRTRDSLWYQEYFMESRGHYTLFRLNTPVAITLPYSKLNRSLEVTQSTDLIYKWSGEFRYSALSHLHSSKSELQIPLPIYRELTQPLNEYLEVPLNLRSNLKEFAEKLTRGVNSAQEAAERITDHLKSNFSYSLIPQKDIQIKGEALSDPLLNFLLKTRSGHCEYFSTTLALSLRSIGIPTRNVTGYHGGEWSPYGGYYIVRQRDAHSWVEVWRGGEPNDPASWVVYDATPPSASISSLMNQLNQWIDHLQFTWFRYIVGFEAKDQVKALQTAQVQTKSLIKYLKHTWNQSVIKRWWIVIFLIPIFILLSRFSFIQLWIRALKRSLLSLLRRGRIGGRIFGSLSHNEQHIKHEDQLRQQEETRARQEATRLYIKMLTLYQRSGYRVESTWTCSELLQSFHQQDVPELEKIERLVIWYESVRFGTTLIPSPASQETKGIQSLREAHHILSDLQKSKKLKSKKLKSKKLKSRTLKS